MKVISGLVSAGSGSIGRCTWSRNRYGPYVRERAVPVNPSTTFQQAVRSFFSNLTVVWFTTLTAAARAAWETYALGTPIPDALGNPQVITGLSMYVKCNAARLNANKTRIDNAPAATGLAILSPLSLIATASTDSCSFAFTNSDTWAVAVTGHLFLYISRPQKASINSFKGPYRFIGAVNGAATPPTSPVAFTSPFPFIAGDRLFFRGQASNSDAKPSPNFRGNAIAV